MNGKQGNPTKVVKIGAIVILLLVAALAGKILLFPNSAAAYVNSADRQDAANVATIKGDVQEVTIKLAPSTYGTIVVQKGIPVRFNMQADAKDLNGCNGTIVIPAYNQQISLKAGDNIMEFTPSETGTVPYSCWMGMVNGSIRVVDDLSKADLAAEPAPAVNSGSKMPCCGR